MKITQLHYTCCSTTIGKLYLLADQQNLRGVFFNFKELQQYKKYSEVQTLTAIDSHPVLNRSIVQLQQYLAGKRREFTLPILPDGTAFQKKVWLHLQKIPYGQTISYTTQASQLKNPLAVRAVASANGRNPLPIIIPCHRVINKNSKLGGYSGGLAIKEHLLALENAALKTGAQ